MTEGPEEFRAALAAAKRSLDEAGQVAPAEALPHLREAADAVGRAMDEAMASSVLGDGLSLRAAGALAGLSENAVGPRLARTAALAPYSEPDGRVYAKGVERARYDVERGDYTPASAPPPMRFRRRRND